MENSPIYDLENSELIYAALVGCLEGMLISAVERGLTQVPISEVVIVLSQLRSEAKEKGFEV